MFSNKDLFYFCIHYLHIKGRILKRKKIQYSDIMRVVNNVASYQFLENVNKIDSDYHDKYSQSVFLYIFELFQRNKTSW